MLRFKIITIFIFETIAFFSPRVMADVQDESAREAFDRGTDAYRNVEFSRALLYFEEAYRLRPSYKIQYNIAQTQLELSRPHLALEAFERYLAEGRVEIGEQRRNEVLIEIRKLRQVVGEIIVMGKTGTECRIDDDHVGFLPLGQPVRLQAGLHEITIHLHGEIVCQKKVQIVAGKKRIEQCRSQDEMQDHPEPASAWDVMSDTSLREFDIYQGPPGRSQTENAAFLRVAPWVSTGLAVAAMSVGTVLAMKTTSLNSELAGACPNGICGQDREDDVAALPKMAAGADVMFAATGLFTAIAVTLFILKKHRTGKEESTPRRPARTLEYDLSLQTPYRFEGGDW